VRYAKNEDLTEVDINATKGIIETTRFDFHNPIGDRVRNHLHGLLQFFELPHFREQAFMMIAKQGTTNTPQLVWYPQNMYPIPHGRLRSNVEIIH